MEVNPFVDIDKGRRAQPQEQVALVGTFLSTRGPSVTPNDTIPPSPGSSGAKIGP